MVTPDKFDQSFIVVQHGESSVLVVNVDIDRSHSFLWIDDRY
jgi:hypothetical protein